MRRWFALVLVWTLVIMVAAGCGNRGTTDEVTSTEAPVTSTAESGSGTTATSGDAAVSATGDSEQDDLEAELEAIERELDAMTLPDDTDFSDIEGALQ